MDDFETPLAVTSKAEGFLEIYNPKNYTLTKLTVKYKWRFRALRASCSQKRFLIKSRNYQAAQTILYSRR